MVGPYLGRVGAGSLPPLLGANGDGLRSVSALVGPNLLGNVFSALGGDGISVFGAFKPICCSEQNQPLLNPLSKSQLFMPHIAATCLSSWGFGKLAARLCVSDINVRGSCTVLNGKAASLTQAKYTYRGTTDMLASSEAQLSCVLSAPFLLWARGDGGGCSQAVVRINQMALTAGSYSVITAIDAVSKSVTVAAPCAACVGGLSPGAEVRASRCSYAFWSSLNQARCAELRLVAGLRTGSLLCWPCCHPERAPKQLGTGAHDCMCKSELRSSEDSDEPGLGAQDRCRTLTDSQVPAYHSH